jgi:hypothetical protein
VTASYTGDRHGVTARLTLVPAAAATAASLFLVSRIWTSIRRRSSQNSRASSQRAVATAPAGVIDPRICAAVWMNGEPDSAGEHCEQQVRHAKRIAAGFEVAAGQAYIAWSLVDGCTPVQQGLRRLTELTAEAAGDRVARLGLLGFQAVLQSIAGEQDDAGALMEQSRQGLADLDLNMTGAAMALFDARMRLRAGDQRGAEEAIQDALRTGRRGGDRWVESTALVDLAHVVIAAGRQQDAARAVAEIDTVPAPRDTEWLVRRLTAQSLFASLSANHETAVRQASDAAARVDGTQFLPLRSHAHWTRALALYHAGHRDQAVRAQETARALALAKGDLAFATSLDPFPPLG